MFNSVNLLHVVVAGLVAAVLGYFYYSPLVLLKRWVTLVVGYARLTPEDFQPKGASDLATKFGAWLVAFIVNAFILAWLIAATGTSDVGGAIVLGLLVWLGFIATFTSGQILFERIPPQLWLINNVFALVIQVVMAVVLVVWK